MTLSKSNRIAICGETFPHDLKHRLLFFDRLAVFDLEATVKALRSTFLSDQDMGYPLNSDGADDLEFLHSKNIVFDGTSLAWNDWTDALPPQQGDAAEQLVADITSYLAVQRGCLEALAELEKQPNDTTFVKSVQFVEAERQFQARVFARLMQCSGLVASALLSNPLQIPKGLRGLPELQLPSTDVIEVVLDKLPMPSELTPWEAILDFKADTEARGYLQGLKVWMGEIARQKLTASEAREKLEWLIFQHKKHLEMHKLSCRWGTFGGTFVATAEILEDLAKIKWGKAAGAVVSIFDKRLELMKAELANPAKEISYIVKAQEQFGD